MAAIVRSVYSAFAEFQPLIILIISLGTYSLVFGHDRVSRVPVLNFLNILRNPLVQFPDVLNWVMVEGKVAAERISQLCEARRFDVERDGAGRRGDVRSADFAFEAAPTTILWDPDKDKTAKFGAGSSSRTCGARQRRSPRSERPKRRSLAPSSATSTRSTRAR